MRESRHPPFPPIASAAEGILWPAVPSPAVTPLHAILLQLERSQWLSTAEIERLQRAQLRSLLLHAQRSVPFYAERLAPIAERLANGPLTPALWSEIPLLRRADIQGAGEEMVSRDLPKQHGKVTQTFTSGSTGKPVAVRHSQLFGLFWRAVTIRNHLWHERDFRGSLAMIRGRKSGALYPEGKTGDNWGIPKAAGIETGPLVSLDIDCTPEQQVDWLIRKQPTYFITHPTNLDRLARYSLEAGLSVPSLREVLSVAEVLTEETRRVTREAWGCPVADMYTGRDLGYLALQCPEQEHYHIQSETILVEILDDQGRPCAPGEIGRVVATPLQEFAMPLIRYDVGDRAEVGSPCACGRGLPVIKRILGRSQQILTLPSGEKRWTLHSAGPLDALVKLGVRQYQVVQKSLERLEVRAAVSVPLSAEQEESLCAWVRDNYGTEFEIGLSYCEEIPRTEEGKFFDFLSELPE